MHRPTAPALLSLVPALALAGCSGDDDAAAAPALGRGEPVFDGPPVVETAGLARLAVEDPVAEFGEVWEGTVLEHEFLLEVEGDEPLRIVSVRPDCGCTVADLALVTADGERAPYEERTEVPPGTRLALAAELHTRGRQGTQDRRVKLFANVPGGVVEVAMRAEVRPFLVVEPSAASLGRISVLETGEAEYAVRSAVGEPFALRATGEAIPPEVRVELAPVDPDPAGRAEAWRVRVVAGPDLPRGTRTWPIRLATDVPNESAPPGDDGEPPPFVVEPTLHASVVGAVSVEPASLGFGVVDPETTVARTVRVRSHDPGFALPAPRAALAPAREGEDATPLAEVASLTVRPAADEEGAYDVELLLDGLPDAVGRSFLAKLVIETGHPDEPRLDVHVTGMRQGAVPR